MKKISLVLVVVAALCTGFAAQERVDFTVIEKIRAEGMDRSKVLETFDYLVTDDRAAPHQLARAQARCRVDRATDEGDGPQRGPHRAVPVRPRLDTEQGVDRNGRAALHALDRVSAGLVAVNGRSHRRDAGLDPGSRRRGDKGSGGKTQGRDPVHQPDPAVRDSRGPSRRERRSEAARSAARRTAAAQRRTAHDVEGRRRRA